MTRYGSLVIVREGHGEAQAIEKLVARVGRDLGLVPDVFATLSANPRIVISSPETAVRAARVAARYRPDAILLTADLDDGCPADVAPRWAQAVRSEGLSMPVALVLFHREYETLALSVADSLAGMQLLPDVVLDAGVSAPADPEGHRDAKGWLGRHLMGGRRYKPTVHQLPLTTLLDVGALRAAGLSSYRRLENAMVHLAAQAQAGTAAVYPA